jgi:hypothetical protein
MTRPRIEMATRHSNTIMVHPPNSSKLPNPKAARAKPDNGKQHGDARAVTKSPIVPILSRLILMLTQIVDRVGLCKCEQAGIAAISFPGNMLTN